MKDIVDDLRNAITRGDSNPWDEALYKRAADEIERLRSELAESARNVISQIAVEDELRSLITAWADASDAWDAYHDADLRDRAAVVALRKAVGR
jgi:hypothetical protein